MAFNAAGSAPTNQSTLFAKPLGQGSSFASFGQTQQQTTGSLFGQPSQQQQPQQSTGSLFGQPTQQPAASTFGQPAGQQPANNFFGQPIAQQPTNSPFGQQLGQQTQQQPAGGLFGQSTAQPASGGAFGQSTTQPSGSLFGQPAAQSSGGLFGQSSTQPATGTGGLFGQSAAQPATGSALFGQSATGGLFGSTTQPAGGSLLGQSTTQPVGSSLFGQSTTQPSGGSFFGGSALQAQPTLPAGGFGGGGALFGGNQPQQSQVSNGPLLSKSTKFNDLPDDMKRTLESIDSHIQGRLQISKDLHQRNLGEEPLKAQELLQGIRKDLLNISAQTRGDHYLAKDMKSKVDQAVQDTIVATRLVDAFKAPQGSGTSYLNSHANFPLEFFTRVTENMRQRLEWYKSTIEQIERKLSSSAGQSQTPQGISATLQAQHATFISLASKTAALDAEFQKIKAFVTQLFRSQTGSIRDPFNDLDRTTDSAEFGIHSLGIK